MIGLKDCPQTLPGIEGPKLVQLVPSTHRTTTHLVKRVLAEMEDGSIDSVGIVAHYRDGQIASGYSGEARLSLVAATNLLHHRLMKDIEHG